MIFLLKCGFLLKIKTNSKKNTYLRTWEENDPDNKDKEKQWDL
jgi:hypothetical protein